MHDSLSDDELQEAQNDHVICTSGFASKDDIQDDHLLYDQSTYEKMYDWLYYSQVAHGYCVKSARFSMGNHQCQQKESQRGNISWKCGKEVTTPYKIETSHRCHSGNNFH